MRKQSKTQLSPGASTERNNLKRPDGIRGGEKPYKCQHCSFASIYYCRLKIHGRVHTGEKPFKCQHCSFKTAHKPNLKYHEQWHTGEMPHKCPLCPYSAVKRSLLEIHERKHTGEKPFKCQYCSFKSAYKSSFKIHERTHTGEKPYKCKHCPYVTTRSSNLISHERKHSGEGPFNCQHCNYTSTCRSHLKIHQKIHMRGNLSKLEQHDKLRSSFTRQKRFQSGRKSLKCMNPRERTTVPSEKYTKTTDLDSPRKQPNRIPSHLQDLLIECEEWDDQENNESSSQAHFDIFICKQCNYALLSEKELCMHYAICHKLPVVSLNV